MGKKGKNARISLQEFKEIVARRYGFQKWSDISKDFYFEIAGSGIDYNGICDIAAELYASQSINSIWVSVDEKEIMKVVKLEAKAYESDRTAFLEGAETVLRILRK